jgi:RNA polymerase sigma factor (sigma-70 family)
VSRQSSAIRLSADVVARLHRQANASRWGLAQAAFGAALERSAAKAFAGDAADSRALDRYLSGLHLEDLALANACAEGVDAAWEHFVLEFRPALYRAAGALDPTGAAREYADSLYADLFGLQERDGERRSLFRYFHGRSSLATWLRAVLAQRHIDGIRSQRRLAPLENDNGVIVAVERSSPPDPDAGRFRALIKIALLHCLAALADRDRLRLACYYREDLTLAQTGRLLGEHEATVSRQLARTRKLVRAEVEKYLRREHQLGDAEIAQCFECTINDPGPLDLGELLGSAAVRKDSEPERST